MFQISVTFVLKRLIENGLPLDVHWLGNKPLPKQVMICIPNWIAEQNLIFCVCINHFQLLPLSRWFITEPSSIMDRNIIMNEMRSYFHPNGSSDSTCWVVLHVILITQDRCELTFKTHWDVNKHFQCWQDDIFKRIVLKKNFTRWFKVDWW